MIKKIIVLLSILFLLICSNTYGMTVKWDTYTDTEASQLRIYKSTDQVNWDIEVTGIPTSYIASELPDGTANARIYYIMRAYSETLDLESGNSNTVSVFWSNNGDGSVTGITGPAGVGGLQLLDCSLYDGTTDDGSINWDTCSNRFNKPTQ